MRKLYLLVMGLLLFACPVINAQVSLTALNSPYNQDFNTLVASGSSTYNTFPAGWFVSETGTSVQVDGKYAIGNGSSGTGNSYSFGTGASTERALGTLRSSSLAAAVEAQFINNTGTTVTTLQITYTGEEWRLGNNTRQDSLFFQYSMDTTVASNWTRVKTGDFWTPNTTAASGTALDGNATSNRKIISFVITGLSIPDGSTFFIRWFDFDAFSSDDCLAVDDFSITPGTAAVNNVFVSAGTNGAEPSTDGSFTVSLTAASATDVTINFDFTGSTATLGSDFTDPLGGTLVIPAGQLSGTIPVHVLDDAIVEAIESVTLNLTGASAPYTVSILSGTINITSDDIATISFTGSYSQDFNTMVTSGTGTITDIPTGWLFNETGTNANDTYAAGDGTSNSGNTYSFGTGTSTDRAMGMLRSSNLVPVMGSLYINNTGATVTSLTITYTGEQWRLGSTGRNDRLDFQYSTDATNLSTGTWTDANGLDFIGPNSTGTPGAFDGNATANRTTLTYIINGLSIPDGGKFAIRWTDLAVSGAEDGLAVDDFTMTLGCIPPTNQPTTLNLTPSLQSISGSFTAAAAGTTNADAYLVLISTSATLTDMPASGTVYAIDDVIGNAKVVSISDTTGFTASGLTPSTTYYFYIFSTGGTTCYNVISPLTGNVATTAPPVCTPPTTQVSNLAAANITGTSMDLSWTRGNGGNVLLIAKANAAVDATIYNSIAYPQDTLLGTGNRVIYNGPASAFSYTGLNQNTTYYFALYEYNIVDSCYLTPALTGNFTTLCTSPVDVSSLSGSAGNTTATVSWTLPASACFDEIIVVASNATIINPGSNYTSPASAAYTGGEQVVYRGTGTNVAVTGFTNSTTYYIKVFTRKGTNYSAGVQTTVIPYDPASGYQYLYGNLHSHSEYSDGNKDDSFHIKRPADDFLFARDALCMDFLGISEHNHSGAGMHKANYPLGFAQADSLNNIFGGSFITLWGMEWGVISGGGHVLVYGFEDKLIGWESGNYDIFVAKDDYPSLWTVVNGQSGAFATLAHPNNTDFSNLASAYDVTADAALVGAAVESGPAFSTSPNYNDFPSSLGYLPYYRTMLAKGFRLAPQMDQDNHYLTFGTANSNRMVVLSSTRSREGLMEAIRSMRYYASEDCNIRVDYKSGNSPMGSQLTGVGLPTLSMNITDADNESTTKIELWGGATGAAVPSAAIKTYTGTNVPSFNFTAADVENIQPNNTTWYYYTVITQQDGNKVVTAPIWYTRNDAALPVTLINFKGTYDRPANKVYLTWTTAQELNSKEFIIERSTDGRQFTAIGKAAAAGIASRQISYSFTDGQPAYGVNYYRLNQVDLDGRSEISGIVKIITDNAGGFITGPNPTSTSVTVYRQNNTEAAKIELMDVNGKLIKQLNMGGPVPSATINVSGLSKGIYLLKLTTTKGIQTEKIMVK